MQLWLITQFQLKCVNIKRMSQSFDCTHPLLTQCCACQLFPYLLFSVEVSRHIVVTYKCLPSAFTNSKHTHTSLLMCISHIIDATQWLRPTVCSVGGNNACFRMLHQNAKCNNIHIRPHLRGVRLPNTADYCRVLFRHTVQTQSHIQGKGFRFPLGITRVHCVITMILTVL